jgi:CheY-like chemotaxis protein
MRVVLIIDDDILERATIVRELHKLPSIEVFDTGTFQGGLQLLDAMDVALVICNTKLPDGDAPTLLQHLVRTRRDIPVLLLGARGARPSGTLPVGVELLARPLDPSVVRDKVTTRLGCEREPGPFSLTDYLQLAAMGQNSVRLELTCDGEEIGTIVVRDGDAWSAEDLLGEGFDAFTRLLARADVSVTCAPLGNSVPRRSLEGSCSQLLMRAMTRIDELRSGHVQEDAPVDDTGAEPRPQLARGSAPILTPRVDNDAEFDRLYELGIEAMLRKRYHDALDALERAKQIRTTATLEANLKRLRAMGVS